MTNEELIRSIYLHPEDTAVMQQLVNNLEGFIRSIAKKIAAAFNCLEYGADGALSFYSLRIIEDLMGEGMLKLVELIAAQKYDESQGRLTTYIYPHIAGVMRRWMEQNLGCVPLSKHTMRQIRQIQRLYHAEGLSVADIAAQTGLPEAKINRLLNYNTHSVSLDELSEAESAAQDSEGTLNPGSTIDDMAESVEDRIVARHRNDRLKQAFGSLQERDRYILGHFFGIFGYEKKTLDELAFEEMMTPDGMFKAKETALRRLRELCGDGGDFS